MSNNPPILQDSAQLVARAYNATAAPEAIAINPDSLFGWNIFYRGAQTRGILRCGNFPNPTSHPGHRRGDRDARVGTANVWS